jgi:hypothetical protein
MKYEDRVGERNLRRPHANALLGETQDCAFSFFPFLSYLLNNNTPMERRDNRVRSAAVHSLQPSQKRD